MKNRKTVFVLKFDEVGLKDIPLVGGKNASLGEMYQELSKKGVNIPYGFAITAYAYNCFLEKSGLKSKIKKILGSLNVKDTRNLSKHAKGVREAILKENLPKELEEEIIKN